MTNLDLVMTGSDGALAIIDPESGEVFALRDAPERSLLLVAARLALLDADLLAGKRAVAHELRGRLGVGKTEAAGFTLTITEAQSWPAGATEAALGRLVADGHIGDGDAKRCMPAKPRPDSRALKALAGRLMVSDPEAAVILVGACTTSPVSVRDVRSIAVDS